MLTTEDIKWLVNLLRLRIEVEDDILKNIIRNELIWVLEDLLLNKGEQIDE